MKAARLHGWADLRVDEEPAPTPGPGEELVRVVAVGLCGSDRHWFMDGGIGDAVISRPLVLGHEVAGVVETGPQKGQRVVVDPAVPCGRCELCQRGLGYLCRDVSFAGHSTTDGGLRQLMTWPRGQLEPLPESIDIDMAALLEPLAVALHAVDLGLVRPGMRAGVFGCGPIGLLLIAVLRSLGVERIVATDPLSHRREAAVSFGASDVLLSGEPLPAIDVAFEVAGEDAALDDALRSIEPRGRVVLVGIPSIDRTSFQASLARRKELTIQLSRRSQPADLRRAIALVAVRQADLRSLVTARYALADAGAAFDELVARRGLKVLVQPDA